MKNIVLAIDLGATNLRIALISKEGVILKRIKAKTQKRQSNNKTVIKELINLSQGIIKDQKKDKLLGIGISTAGPINAKKGILLNPPNMPYRNLSLKAPLEDYFSLPVTLLNDCSAAVWGEKHFGKGQGYSNVVYLTISSGIGGGVIVDNHLLYGRDGNAAEVGHFIIDTKYNFPCSCKKGIGHWEGYCSGKNLIRFFNYWLRFHKIKKKYSLSQPTEIFKLAQRKDKTILKFLEAIGKLNGKGVSNLIVAYDPEIIILGGAVVLNNKKFILPYLKKNIDHFLSPPKITVTSLKENAPLYGAAALVFYPPYKKS